MKRAGLTLIELLVAMAILGIIVLAVAQLFQQSTVAWESGYRRTRTAMVGRAILGYVAEDIGLAVWDDDLYDPPIDTGNGVDFWALRGTNRLESITYEYESADGGKITRNSVELYQGTENRLAVMGFTVAPFPDLGYADVSVEVMTSDKGRYETRTFQRRVYLVNRNRYDYD
ncbi:MAG: prepilin-type N-terminal cleavage/methylation domain-containing protein [Kiritimatiellia bacterium]|jgi:prepilin-type N-terminal cleavage/methylation domain-containing protein|nr:prepilin-type N-terminal cleavage/methylation domain-containing protein [Kiritimatiellia bacterium]